jgi:hypothetical protein
MSTPALDYPTLAEQIGLHHSADDVAQAVIDRIAGWGPAYLGALYPDLGPLRAVVRLSDFVDFQENRLPAAVIVIPGTIGEPMKDGHGMFQATYQVLVGIVSLARTEDATRRVCEQYSDAVRLSLIHNRRLAPDVKTEDWLSEATDSLAVMETRHLLLCTNAFAVRLENIGSWQAGPDSGTPPAEIEPWPTATDVQLTITKVS